MVVPPLTKSTLRSGLKKRRDDIVFNLSNAERSASFTALKNRVLCQIDITISAAFYIAIASEIDPFPLLNAVAANGIQTALPHITHRHDTPRFLAWRPGEDLEAGPFGLLQPRHDAPELTPMTIFTPLLGFDTRLNRIGYGAGHYDRAFARFPLANRIGLAWDTQRVDAIPADPWDIPLHAIATEKDWYS